MPSDPAPAPPVPVDAIEAAARWDLGEVASIVPLPGGSSASPKFVVRAVGKSYVLKCRAAHAGDVERIAFAHGFMHAAAGAGVPVAMPIRSRDGAAHEIVAARTWEVFPFVEGERWSRQPGQARAAGEALGCMHAAGIAFTWHGHVQAASFHGNLNVLEALRRVPRAVHRVEPDVDMVALANACETLAEAYTEAAAAVEEVGYAQLDSQVVHGDFHPGNVIFDGDRVAAVIDFDAARLEPAVVDFANGLMQFACFRGTATRVAAWPAELDALRLAAFTHAYAHRGDRALADQVDMVPPLMIEACVSEASLPIARRGRFGPAKASEVLQLVARRVNWLRRNGAQVREWLLGSLC
ncbi:MAG: phosphotransferase enzyme family protein [Phycisphaerales bacterium]|jgi:Ser/Thr protein kinase RdoA (MazF antagonist)